VGRLVRGLVREREGLRERGRGLLPLEDHPLFVVFLF
jgi:hypothetical protein